MLRRSETEEEMERLEKRQKLLALIKEVRQEQQAMAIAEAQPGAGKLTEIGSIALPLGITLATGVLREVSAQRAGHNLPQRSYHSEPTLLRKTGSPAVGSSEEKIHAVEIQQQQEAHRSREETAQVEQQERERQQRQGTQQASLQQEIHQLKQLFCRRRRIWHI